MLGAISLYTFIVYDDLPSAALLHAIWFKEKMQGGESEAQCLIARIFNKFPIPIESTR